jgi:hypothetical protein
MKQQEQKQLQPSQNQIPNQVNNTKENSDAEATTYTNITHQKEVLTKKLTKVSNESGALEDVPY